LKENVNQKEVLNLKEDILKIYRKIRWGKKWVNINY
jgi:hypothetical protein